MDSLRGLLEAHGVHAVASEGEMEYSPSHATIRAENARHLDPLSRRVLDLLVLEDRTPMGGDAALGISWSELADRLATADDLHTRHPNAVADSLVEGFYRSYLTGYLGDFDNTPGFSFHAPHELLPALRASYARYARVHAATRSGRIVAAYTTLLRAHHWRRTPETDAFIRASNSGAAAPR